jgi:hypothetical protein
MTAWRSFHGNSMGWFAGAAAPETNDSMLYGSVVLIKKVCDERKEGASGVEPAYTRMDSGWLK